MDIMRRIETPGPHSHRAAAGVHGTVPGSASAGLQHQGVRRRSARIDSQRPSLLQEDRTSRDSKNSRWSSPAPRPCASAARQPSISTSPSCRTMMPRRSSRASPPSTSRPCAIRGSFWTPPPWTAPPVCSTKPASSISTRNRTTSIPRRCSATACSHAGTPPPAMRASSARRGRR